MRFVNWVVYANQILKLTEQRYTPIGRPMLGGMYTYNYSPKYRDKLPYYDIFPLTAILGYTRNGFIGINFHYLPEPDRRVLMKVLTPFTRQYLDKKIIRMNYIFFTRLARSFWGFAVKRYLWNHLLKKMLYIPSNAWDIVLQMPVVSFKKMDTRMVYRDFRLNRVYNAGKHF